MRTSPGTPEFSRIDGLQRSMRSSLRRTVALLDVARSRARMRAYAAVIPNIGAHVLIARGNIISSPENLTLGDHVFINARCVLHAEGGLTIGSGTKIGPHTTIWTSNHRFESDVPFRTQGSSFAPVRIGKDVWIGASVSIVAGVTIGDGAVVGAGSVVTRDVEPFAVAAGNPARMIRSRIR